MLFCVCETPCITHEIMLYFQTFSFPSFSYGNLIKCFICVQHSIHYFLLLFPLYFLNRSRQNVSWKLRYSLKKCVRIAAREWGFKPKTTQKTKKNTTEKKQKQGRTLKKEQKGVYVDTKRSNILLWNTCGFGYTSVCNEEHLENVYVF